MAAVADIDVHHFHDSRRDLLLFLFFSNDRTKTRCSRRWIFLPPLSTNLPCSRFPASMAPNVCVFMMTDLKFNSLRSILVCQRRISFFANLIRKSLIKIKPVAQVRRYSTEPEFGGLVPPTLLLLCLQIRLHWAKIDEQSKTRLGRYFLQKNFYAKFLKRVYTLEGGCETFNAIKDWQSKFQVWVVWWHKLCVCVAHPMKKTLMSSFQVNWMRFKLCVCVFYWFLISFWLSKTLP